MKKDKKICFPRVAVVGDGGWGTTLAILLSLKGRRVTLWSPFCSYASLLDRKRENLNYLKGISIPKDIHITSDFLRVVENDLIVLAVPSEYVRKVLEKNRKFYSSSCPVVSVIKGIENKTFLRMSEVVSEIWRPEALAVLSGPTIAQEVARQIPSAAVVASRDKDFMVLVQELFMTDFFRVYTNPDIVGVELGGSLKNVIAIACGISDGLGFGTNAKAAILSRGLVEMGRLGEALGGKKETFSGISGLGDLVTTCFNPLSRNHFVGYQIGRGRTLKQLISTMKMVAEGVPTSRSVWSLAKIRKIEAPIIEEIYHVLFKKRLASNAVKNLMMRSKKSE